MLKEERVGNSLENIPENYAMKERRKPEVQLEDMSNWGKSLIEGKKSSLFRGVRL